MILLVTQEGNQLAAIITQLAFNMGQIFASAFRSLRRSPKPQNKKQRKPTVHATPFRCMTWNIGFDNCDSNEKHKDCWNTRKL